LARRSGRFGFDFGSLARWMTSHVATGVLALVLALLHSAMAPRASVGGDALWALVVLFVSGAIGRYLYAWVPRAANGRELALEEVKLRLTRLAHEWDASQRGFVESVRRTVEGQVDAGQWSASFLGRLRALFVGRRELTRRLAELARSGRTAGVPEERIAQTMTLAREAHSTALMAAHYEDLRGVLSSWRYIHRWVALLLVVLLVLHVVIAFIYSGHLFGGDGS